MIVAATPENIRQAAELLKSGQAVVFPTETVYGLGANAFNQAAVDQIFEIKKRPVINPLIVHIRTAEQVFDVAAIKAGSLCQKRVELLLPLWPGPLSLVLPKKTVIAANVTANLDTVAIRVPAHPVALALLNELDFPLAAPSANISSEVSPTSAEHVWQSLGERVPLILDGGECQVGLESTVLALHGEKPVLLRPGCVTREELEEILNERIEGFKIDHGDIVSSAAVPSPGLLQKHYTPKTRIILRGSLNPTLYPKRVGLICFQDISLNSDGFEYTKVLQLSQRGDLEEIARRLFAAIHQLDQMALDLIVVDVCPEQGIGAAIMDRLKRACGSLK